MTTGRPTFAERFGDAEQRKLIDSFPLSTPHSVVAAACRDVFGATRAWPARKIMEYRLARQQRGGRLSFADRDPALASFIEDRIGCGTIDWIHSEAIRAFGAKRVPSRSAIHEHVERVRSRGDGRSLASQLDDDPDVKALVEAAFNIASRWQSIVSRRRRRTRARKA